MGKTKYTRAKEFLDMIKNEFGDSLHFDFFLIQMKKKIGADEQRTIKPYLSLMLDTDLIAQKEEKVIIR